MTESIAKKNGRGGKRSNSGRKKGEETTIVNFRVTLDLVEPLKAHGKRFIEEFKIKKGFKRR
jgi:hypothetical protein